jgi:FPC/CPF motif-containing protein YcgG
MEGLVDGEPLTRESLAIPALGNFCRPDGGVLSRPFDANPPSALTALVHGSFRALALNEQFSCVAGRAAVRNNAYRFGLYDQLGTLDASAALACDLSRFIEDADLRNEPLRTFVASFINPVPVDEVHFEKLMWTTLQQLSDRDSEPWTPNSDSDPDDSHFTFSFGGIGFFIVGLHARSSRLVRRFAWSTLVFNPHEQFDRLRQDGSFSRFREIIRAREMTLQGTVNPMLKDFGEESEARQYSGRHVGDQWKCPFHVRDRQSRPVGE